MKIRLDFIVALQEYACFLCVNSKPTFLHIAADDCTSSRMIIIMGW